MSVLVKIPPEILQPPRNITVFPDQIARFTCEVTGGHATWAVNGKSIFDIVPTPLYGDLDTSFTFSEDGNPLLILTITARAEYNGTTVQCWIYGGFSGQSEIASLRVQGRLDRALWIPGLLYHGKCMSKYKFQNLPFLLFPFHSGPLSAVGDLRASSNASSVTISWTAPFSLDVTGVDPDTWYSVLIYNVTDENNPTAILCTDCINITETHYTFTPDYIPQSLFCV